jgi:hypothetical protein
VLTSSSEEDAGEPFRTGYPVSVALRSRSPPNAVRRSRHSGQGRASPSRSISLLTCSNVSSSVNRELVTNSVRHSGSAVPGGLVTVTVAARGEGARIEVTDRSGDSVPVLHPADGGGEAEGSRGCGSWTRWPRAGVTSGGSGARGSSYRTADISPCLWTGRGKVPAARQLAAPVHPMKVSLESSASARSSWRRRWISNRPANRAA